MPLKLSDPAQGLIWSSSIGAVLADDCTRSFADLADDVSSSSARWPEQSRIGASLDALRLNVRKVRGHRVGRRGGDAADGERDDSISTHTASLVRFAHHKVRAARLWDRHRVSRRYAYHRRSAVPRFVRLCGTWASTTNGIEGAAASKIHPATYLAFFTFGLLIIGRRNRIILRRLRHASPGALAFLFATLMLAAYICWYGRKGIATIFDTYLLAVMVVLILAELNDREIGASKSCSTPCSR